MSAIALQTRQSAETVDEFVEALEGRVQALSVTRDLLIRAPGEPVDLEALIRGELKPYAAEQTRVTVEGPPVRIDPSVAQSLGMVIHELMTNAAKYGALSNGGRINIEWRRSEGGKVALRRREHVEGKKVAPPEKRGFGLNVIENGMTYATDGRAHVAFEPEGLRWEAEVPLADHE